MRSHESIAGALHRIWDSVLLPLCKLNRIQFAAPWQTRRPPC
jgi:hypothetical protein